MRQQAPRGASAWWVAVPLVILLVVGGIVGVSSNVQRSADYDYSLPEDTRSTGSTSTVDTSVPGTSAPDDAPGSAGELPSDTGEAPQPPESTGPRPVYELRDNPLFFDVDAGVPNVTCQLSAWRNDPAAAERFYNAALSCLNDGWSQVLAAADLPFQPPSLSAPASGGGRSPCASSGETFAAYYCGDNTTIYLPYETTQVDQYGAQPGVYLSLLAHEYAHHVQQQSGILSAAYERQYEQGGSTAAGLTTQRRIELQAQCFSGMFMTAAYNGGGDVNDQLFDEAANSQDRGDDPGGPRSHGTDEHTISWWQHGARYNRNFQCNTWGVDAGAVS